MCMAILKSQLLTSVYYTHVLFGGWKFREVGGLHLRRTEKREERERKGREMKLPPIVKVSTP